MKKIVGAFIVSFLVVFGSYGRIKRRSHKRDHIYKLCKSVATFHLSLGYNAWKYGNAFNFAAIAQDNGTAGSNGVYVEQDEDGNIVAINDGKKTPLILGSIPQTKKNIAQLRKSCNVHHTQGIDIFSICRRFERDWAGLSRLERKKEHKLQLFKYPTTDDTAPILDAIVHAVCELKNRDERNQGLAYVHCKAGRGRSATIVVAYLLTILHEAGIDATPKQIEDYLKSRRPQVELTVDQRKVISQFQEQLKEAGSIEHLKF